MKRRFRTVSRLMAVFVFALPLQASAQDGFFFKQPYITVSVKAGPSLPRASGELFDFMTDQLTLSRRDFQSVGIQVDAGVRLSPRVDLVLGVGHAQSETPSHFRDWTDVDDLEIEQTTQLRRTPFSAGLRYYIRERGRELGEHAWVPSSFQPYVGAGAGVMFYEVEQDGDFVDFQDLGVFSAHLTSEGTTPLLQLMAGAEWWMTSQVGLTVDGRYLWSSDDLHGDFADFGTVKLHGAQLTAGLAVRF